MSAASFAKAKLTDIFACCVEGAFGIEAHGQALLETLRVDADFAGDGAKP
jgi:hypothetical protein